MVDLWIVFSGWATPASLLAPLFGPKAALIELDAIMPSLVSGGVLRPNWQEIAAEIVRDIAQGRPFGCAGWSTGSLLAYAASQRLSPRAAVFLSATPSFCRRPGFPIGQKPSILRAMRERLATDPEDVLTKFYAQCGLPIPEDDAFDDKGVQPLNKGTKTLKSLYLVDGLHLLEQATLLPVKPLPCRSLFLHGKSDAVVPFQAGARFCEAAGGKLKEYVGGHAFFAGREEEVGLAVREYFY